jgi:hypothetical protein
MFQRYKDPVHSQNVRLPSFCNFPFSSQRRILGRFLQARLRLNGFHWRPRLDSKQEPSAQKAIGQRPAPRTGNGPTTVRLERGFVNDIKTRVRVCSLSECYSWSSRPGGRRTQRPSSVFPGTKTIGWFGGHCRPVLGDRLDDDYNAPGRLRLHADQRLVGPADPPMSYRISFYNSYFSLS